VEDKDANQTAEELVRKITESEPAKGEHLLGSEKLKRQLRYAKERFSKRSSERRKRQ
jgi:hypothetical protein